MPLEAPKLDDRTFDQIKTELRARIARYTPEWTDFNESDPGITLIELFAWLSEMMLYQMNRVPERNYIKFLQLLNLELRPPLPAEAHLTFTPKKGAAVGPIGVRTQVGAQSADTGDLVIFETDTGLDPVSLALASLQVFDGAAYTDVSQANEQLGVGFRPLGWRPQVGSALLLGFVPPDPPPPPGTRLFPQQLRLRVLLPVASQAGVAQRCAPGGSGAETPPAPPVNLVWEYRHPKSPQRWRRLTVYLDETAAFTREGYIVVEGPAEIAATAEGKVQDAPHLWLRCRLDAGTYPGGQEPEIDGLRPNTVSARSLATTRNEVLGVSEGQPNQSFTLRYKPVRKLQAGTAGAEEENLQLQMVPVGQAAETWSAVDDFLASGADDAHYVLNATTGEIRFGDGCHGRIPAAGAEIVAASYRYGGGTAANVAADSITIPLTGLVGIDSVTNLRPAVGGRDEQSVDDLKLQAPSTLRHRNRAVTEGDFAELARLAGGVARATALALAHPDYPGVAVPGAVTVVVVPVSTDMPPQPSGDLIRHVCAYLGDYRLLTTELFVAGPRYVEIRVEVVVEAKPYVAAGTVEDAVRTALNERLDPLVWPFGSDFHPTGLYRDIYRVTDANGAELVSNVKYLAITVDGVPHEDLRLPVTLQGDQLIYGGEHDIVVVPEQDA
jgi:predicted phage baseplate assembly protein